ncbi:Testis-specific protein 35 [Polynucleobacter victoriensis]|uniref:Testis-specific protein 35 n=2 Tax=Polynucleobacter victoriensis TaxID=2049319 RepID=A0A212T202_9BURK|nr:Testis-specific protein 35 [Polynucleobacter victoriensis]
MIDTLTLKETFESNGFSATQASSLSHAMHELAKDKAHLATKEELHLVRNELKNDIKEVREEIKDVRGEIKDLRNQMTNLWDCLKDLRKEMTKDMENLENRLLHKLTYRTMLSQLSIGTILVTLMIYFHQQ